MLKNLKYLGVFILLLAGCTREVYLEPVPCVEGCPECPCVEENPLDCCPEVVAEKEILQYQIYDVPAKQVEYKVNDCEEKPNCRTVCKKVLKSSK